MASNANTYRKNADDCSTLAARSVRPADKERWLKIAEQWLQMAQEADKTER
jgi:hypothetical protein